MAPKKKTRSVPKTNRPPPARSGSVRRYPPPTALPLAGVTKESPEDQERIRLLVKAVSEEDGMTLPADWVLIADQAKRKGYVREHALRLFLTDLGRQWLAAQAAPAAARQAFTMTKISKAGLIELKTLAHETGVLMQDAIG